MWNFSISNFFSSLLYWELCWHLKFWVKLVHMHKQSFAHSLQFFCVPIPILCVTNLMHEEWQEVCVGMSFDITRQA